jgi:ribosomal protein L14E/L6E/L27E
MAKKQAKKRALRPNNAHLLLTRSVSIEHRHESSEDVARKIARMELQRALIDDEIESTNTRLRDAKQRRAETEAILLGLQNVLASR